MCVCECVLMKQQSGCWGKRQYDSNEVYSSKGLYENYLGGRGV